MRLPNEILCPYVTRDTDCIFVVDYVSAPFVTPPVSPGDVSVYGQWLAKACVGPERGSGGTLQVEQSGLAGSWTLRFEIKRAMGVEEGIWADGDY